MNKKAVLKWEILGFFFIVILGTLLHFCFEWSGRFIPFALFCAVNESVWEHLKLGFWPSLFFAGLEYIIWGKDMKNFRVAKTIALYTIPISITILFYTYTALLGTHMLPLDIAIFVISVLFSQYVSYRLTVSYRDYSALNKTAIILLLVLTLAFSLFTYFPPDLEPFLDPLTGKPGITAY